MLAMEIEKLVLRYFGIFFVYQYWLVFNHICINILPFCLINNMAILGLESEGSFAIKMMKFLVIRGPDDGNKVSCMGKIKFM